MLISNATLYIERAFRQQLGCVATKGYINVAIDNFVAKFGRKGM